MPRKPLAVLCPLYKRRYQGKGYASIKCSKPYNIGFSRDTTRILINRKTFVCFSVDEVPVLARNNYMDVFCKKDYDKCRYYQSYINTLKDTELAD